jgi:hypothetical protein
VAGGSYKGYASFFGFWSSNSSYEPLRRHRLQKQCKRAWAPSWRQSQAGVLALWRVRVCTACLVTVAFDICRRYPGYGRTRGLCAAYRYVLHWYTGSARMLHQYLVHYFAPVQWVQHAGLTLRPTPSRSLAGMHKPVISRRLRLVQLRMTLQAPFKALPTGTAVKDSMAPSPHLRVHGFKFKFKFQSRWTDGRRGAGRGARVHAFGRFCLHSLGTSTAIRRRARVRATSWRLRLSESLHRDWN